MLVDEVPRTPAERSKMAAVMQARLDGTTVADGVVTVAEFVLSLVADAAAVLDPSGNASPRKEHR